MVKDYMSKNDFSGKANRDGFFHMTPFELALDMHPKVIADALNGGTGGCFRCKHYGPYGRDRKRITCCWWVPSEDAPIVKAEPDAKFEEWK